MSPRRVVVVGGGITGLTTAYRLVRAGHDGAGRPLSVTLLEERPRLGGNIQTERRDGFVIDGGPDSFVVTRPQAANLCRELGLGDRMIGTTEKNRKVYIRQGGALHPLPEGLVLAIPSRVWPLAKSPLFSWPGKARMALDLLLPRRPEIGDESVGHFIRRRLGNEALERLAEPLLGGIYAGNVDSLSLRATFPQLLDLERKHRSLIRGAVAQRAARKDQKGRPPPSLFTSLLGGMGELVDALAAAIKKGGGELRTSAGVASIHAGALPGGKAAPFRLELQGGGEPLLADDVVLTTPAHAAATALDSYDRDLAARLRQVPYVSSAVVVFGFTRADVPHALDASGLIIPKGEKRRALAATFISSKWAGRAPSDAALLRVFLGGHRDPGALAQTDDELIQIARDELGALLGLRAKPTLARVYRYDRANAQPVIGHLDRVEKMRSLAAEHPGLHLAGAAFDGVGIPDCVRQATEVADRILA